MTKKPAIAYCVAPKVCSSAYGVFEITSENSRRVFGRDSDGDASQRALRDAHGRFPTRELAQAAVDAVAAVQRHHDPLVSEAAQRARSLAMVRNAAIDRALREIKVTPVAALEVVRP